MWSSVADPERLQGDETLFFIGKFVFSCVILPKFVNNVLGPPFSARGIPLAPLLFKVHEFAPGLELFQYKS